MLRVLVGCETSGTVREAFASLGWDAYSCDLLPSKVQTDKHIIGDVLNYLDDGWDLLIGHPPCTYLAVSGMHWTTRGLRDPQLTEDAVQFARQMMGANVNHIAIENPVSVLSSRIRKPDQIFQPYEFGHNWSKRTCLWLKNLPKLTKTEYVSPDHYVDGKPRWANQAPCGACKLGPSKDRWQKRSVTFKNVAKAMATQWTAYILGNEGITNPNQYLDVPQTI